MRHLHTLVLLPMLLSACHQYPPRACERGDQIQVQVRSPINDTSNRSAPLSAGQSIRGEFGPVAALRVDTVAVQIGNGGGSATGEVAFQLCQDGRCTAGTASLAGSADNAYLPIPLAPGLPITLEGGIVSYTLERTSGEGEMLAWVYPGSNQHTQMQQGVDTSSTEVLNLMFRQY